MDYFSETQTSELREALEYCLSSEENEIRAKAIVIIPEADLKDEEAVALFNKILQSGTTREKQAAFAGLKQVKVSSAQKTISASLKDILNGNLDQSLHLDVIEAATDNSNEEIAQLLQKIEGVLRR